MGRDISRHDIHIQFIGTYEGLEGDSASLSVITAVISAMEGVMTRRGFQKVHIVSLPVFSHAWEAFSFVV